MKTAVWMAIIFSTLFVIPIIFIGLQAIIDWQDSLLRKWIIVLENDIDIK